MINLDNKRNLNINHSKATYFTIISSEIKSDDFYRKGEKYTLISVILHCHCSPWRALRCVLKRYNFHTAACVF